MFWIALEPSSKKGLITKLSLPVKSLSRLKRTESRNLATLRRLTKSTYLNDLGYLMLGQRDGEHSAWVWNSPHCLLSDHPGNRGTWGWLNLLMLRLVLADVANHAETPASRQKRATMSDGTDTPEMSHLLASSTTGMLLPSGRITFSRISRSHWNTPNENARSNRGTPRRAPPGDTTCLYSNRKNIDTSLKSRVERVFSYNC